MKAAANRWVTMVLALSSALSVGCGGDGDAEMTVTVVGLQEAIGVWEQPQLVNLILYAPRPAGAPVPQVNFNDPQWNSERDERRITAWNGDARMTFTVAWPRGTIDELRVQAVIASGPCGRDRIVLAEGIERGLAWNGAMSTAVTVRMERREFRIPGDVTSEECR